MNGAGLPPATFFQPAKGLAFLEELQGRGFFIMGVETETFFWIVGGGVLMCIISLAGAFTLVLKEHVLKSLLLPLVAFSAGSLIGGAFFHMIPEAVEASSSQLTVFLWVVVGFAVFLIMEQVLHWHHCHRASSHCVKPLSYLILIGDGIHNFIGGIAVAGTFMIDIRAGIATWLAAAAHEIPQEIGDFGILLYGGWSPKKALTFNLLSASTFLIGGLLAYFIASHIQINYLIPFAAGTFLYIGASDLIPEVNRHHSLAKSFLHSLCFASGLALLLVLRLSFHS